MNFGGSAATQCSEAESFAIMDAYVKAGGNLIDTANIYSGGESERIVGRWLASPAMAGKRASIILATKARNAMAGPAGGPNDSGLSRSHLTAALADSLARLQTEYIDLYQCHVWDDGTPLEETLRTLNDFITAGKVRYYGFSNCTGAQLQKIVETAKRLGLAPCASLQQQYSLLCRSTELEVTGVCESEGVALMPWSPLKGGWLSGKMVRDAAIPEGSRVAWAQTTGSKMQSGELRVELGVGSWRGEREDYRSEPAPPHGARLTEASPFPSHPRTRAPPPAPTFDAYANNDRVWALLGCMAAIAEAHPGATVAQVALRWLLQKRVTTSVVIGCKSVKQLDDNLACLAFTLTDAEMAALDNHSLTACFPEGIPYPYEVSALARAVRDASEVK